MEIDARLRGSGRNPVAVANLKEKIKNDLRSVLCLSAFILYVNIL